MPAAIPLGPGHHNDERSLLDLIVPEDSRTVVDAFTLALARGVGVARVHMASDPSRPLILQYLDLQEEYGVLFRMLVPANEVDGVVREMVRVSALAPARPRLGIMTKNEVASIQSIDGATTLMLGWSESDMIDHSTLEFIHPDDRVRAIDNWMSRLSDDLALVVQTVRLRYLCKDGSWLWLETTNDFQETDDGPVVVVTKLIDVSDEMAAVEALRRNEEFLRQMTDTVPVGLFHVAHDGTVAFVNPVLRELIGVGEVETITELAEAMLPGEGSLVEEAIEGVMARGVNANLDISLAEHDDGSRWSFRVTLRAVTDGPEVRGVLGCVVDVTELTTLAQTDELTGLRNRRRIIEILATELRLNAGRVSVIFIDLNAFKLVNDEYGHHVGDELLVAVGERFGEALRPTDRIGRIGGDEFLVVCPGLHTAATALAVAARLQESIRAEIVLSEASVHLSAGFGVACGRLDITVDELVSHADAAMYVAKQVHDGPPVCLD